MRLEDVFQGSQERPYIIAEVGVNHEGSMETARRSIREAREGGADAVKFQTYKADKIAAKESPAYWDLSKEPTKSQYELFKKHDSFGRDEFEQLAAYSGEVGIDFLSTPFDVEAADYLAPFMPAIKISSSDITNKPFIQYLCGFGKPVILSTGASYLHEIAQAVEWIEEFDVPLSLLHCVLSYPTQDNDANLIRIAFLKERFPGIPIGYSDHTLPDDMEVCTAATLLGARIIEKHFTHDKTLPGNDHYHAMDVDDLRDFRKRLDRLTGIVGRQTTQPVQAESQARAHARRSLVACRDIPKGSRITRDDLTFKRPASGISPAMISEVEGRMARVSIPADTILEWAHLE